MLDRGLARGFEPAVEREAQAARRARRALAGERRDLRELPTFTVDPASARDFDDAISAGDALAGDRRRGRGSGCTSRTSPRTFPRARRWTARRAGARRACMSPGAVEPMLPHALSSDACSLVPGEDRAAVTVELELHGASVARAAFYRSLIRSDVRLDYERVDRIFAGAERAAEPWGGPLARRARRRRRLQASASARGALAIDSRGAGVRLRRARQRQRRSLARAQTESHRLIEHLMIAANEAVAAAAVPARRAVPVPRPRAPGAGARRAPDRPARLARGADAAAARAACPPRRRRSWSGRSRRRSSSTCAAAAAGARRSARSCCARSSRPTTRRPTSATPACARLLLPFHLADPPLPRHRLPPRAALHARRRERAPRAGELAELGAWTSEREREAMVIERDADDVARCFALERAAVRARARPGLRRRGHGADLGGRVRRLRRLKRARRAPLAFEGMLPVRLLRAPRADGAREWWELGESARSSAASAAARRSASATPRATAWELNEWTRSCGRRSGAGASCAGAAARGRSPAASTGRVDRACVTVKANSVYAST